MEYISGKKEFQIKEPTAVTLGKFDGRHRGHQKLMAAMKKIGLDQGYKTAVFTFGTAPGAVVNSAPQKVITTNEERRENMRKTGIDYLVEYPFDQETAHMAPEDFVRQILVGRMNGKAIVVGTDCSFGYKGAGDAALLERLAPVYGYKLQVVMKEQDDHRDISSTYVKEELDRGDIEKANELLGEPYAIHGIVVHGNGLGNMALGFPTANIIPPPEKYLPAFGVYVSSVLAKDREYCGVTNIGRKPTIGGDNPVGVETCLLGFDGNLYGEYIEVRLMKCLRREKKFSSLDELKEQIGKDKAAAAAYWESSLCLRNSNNEKGEEHVSEGQIFI